MQLLDPSRPSIWEGRSRTGRGDITWRRATAQVQSNRRRWRAAGTCGRAGGPAVAESMQPPHSAANPPSHPVLFPWQDLATNVDESMDQARNSEKDTGGEQEFGFSFFWLGRVAR